MLIFSGVSLAGLLPLLRELSGSISLSPCNWPLVAFTVREEAPGPSFQSYDNHRGEPGERFTQTHMGSPYLGFFFCTSSLTSTMSPSSLVPFCQLRVFLTSLCVWSKVNTLIDPLAQPASQRPFRSREYAYVCTYTRMFLFW